MLDHPDGFDPDTHGWQVQCRRGSIEVVERAVPRPGLSARLQRYFSAEGVQKRAEEHAGPAMAAAGPARVGVVATLPVRTTPVRRGLGLLVDKGPPAPPTFLISASGKAGRWSYRGVACEVAEADVDWCKQALAAIMRGSSIPGLHRTWASVEYSNLSVPPGCAVPKPQSIGCRDSSVVWTVDPTKIDRFLANTAIEKAIVARGGSVERQPVECRVRGRAGHCEARRYTMRSKDGKTATRVGVYARSRLADGREIGIVCDAGLQQPGPLRLPPVCQTLIYVRR
jgi:hypothetical protein